MTNGGISLKKLNAAVDRFVMKHPRFGIPNLMKWIVIGNVLVYLLAVFAGYEAVSFLGFSWAAVARGELWRLVTFVFLPGYYSQGDLLWLALFLYLYYMIGTTLEREWGTAKFNLYYLSGVVLTLIVGIVAGLVFHTNLYITGADYVNLSMFFAFAVLFPNAQVLLFFIIPVKMKWLAYLDGALFAFDIISAVGRHNWGGVVLPIVALLNFAVFIWPEVHYLRQRTQYQASRKTVQFRQAQQQQARQQEQQGYHHKCAVCGKTDTDYPDMQFRYCSKCAGYHCFCQDHIFNHVHFTEE